MASRGEIWLVDFGPAGPSEPANVRPALVVGPPSSFGEMPVVFVAPITRTRRGLDVHVEVPSGSDTGLDDSSYVESEKTRSVSRRRLVRRLGEADAGVRFAVGERLRRLLAF